MSLRTLTEIADKQVKRAIEAVNGVGQVDLGGGRAREIHVVVDIEKLNGYNLTIEQVKNAVTAENIEVPGGTVEQGKAEILLRTLGRVDAAEEFNHIIIATVNGTPIRVSDIGYCRGHHRAAASGGVAERVAGGDARHPPRHRREHDRGDRGRQGEARRGPAVPAEGGDAHDHARRLAVHLRVDRLARGAPAAGAASWPGWS